LTSQSDVRDPSSLHYAVIRLRLRYAAIRLRLRYAATSKQSNAQGNPAGFAKRRMPLLHILSKRSKYKVPHRVDKRKEQKLSFLLLNIWYTHPPTLKLRRTGRDLTARSDVRDPSSLHYAVIRLRLRYAAIRLRLRYAAIRLRLRYAATSKQAK